MKKLSAFVAVFVLLAAFSLAVDTDRVPATVNPSGTTVVIPAHAVEVADGVFDLGTTEHDGRTVQGYAFVDYKKEFAKPGGGSGKSTCYTFLGQGAKWKSLESWIVNPANNQGLSSAFVFSNLGADIQKWEDAAGKNILGDGSTNDSTLSADTSSPDGLNEVYFGDVDSSGAIAVTIVWGIFGGPPQQRELIEWDQVYDHQDFNWSASGEAGKMDFENIATHELGHTVGMGHPSDSCAEETMFRFAVAGETKKRDLNAGDIAGVKKLYG